MVKAAEFLKDDAAPWVPQMAVKLTVGVRTRGSFDLNVTIPRVGGNLAEGLEMGHVRISLSGERTGRSDFIISVFDGIKVLLPSSNDGFVT